jgi:hypothetical protein
MTRGNKPIPGHALGQLLRGTAPEDVQRCLHNLIIVNSPVPVTSQLCENAPQLAKTLVLRVPYGSTPVILSLFRSVAIRRIGKAPTRLSQTSLRRCT